MQALWEALHAGKVTPAATPVFVHAAENFSRLVGSSRVFLTVSSAP